MLIACEDTVNAFANLNIFVNPQCDVLKDGSLQVLASAFGTTVDTAQLCSGTLGDFEIAITSIFVGGDISAWSIPQGYAHDDEI